jgi:hypothetical protein
MLLGGPFTSGTLLTEQRESYLYSLLGKGCVPKVEGSVETGSYELKPQCVKQQLETSQCS